MTKRSKRAPAPSRATLKRLPKLSKTAVKLLVRLYEGKFYPRQFPTSRPMQELIDGGLVELGARVCLLKSCYVPKGTVPHVAEQIPPMPNWIRQVYVERTFDEILPRVKKTKPDERSSVPPKRA